MGLSNLAVSNVKAPIASRRFWETVDMGSLTGMVITADNGARGPLH